MNRSKSQSKVMTMTAQRFFSVFLLIVVAAPVYAQTVSGWRGDGSGVFPDVNPPLRWSLTDNVVWRTKMPSRSNSQPVIAGDRLFVCAEPFNLLCLRLTDGSVLWERSNSYRDITSDTAWTEIEKELTQAQRLRRRIEELDEQLKALEKRKQDGAEAAALAEKEKLEAQLKTLPLAERYTLPITQEQYNGFTTATPTTDGKHVWYVFGNRVVVCYDIDGNRKWAVVLPDHPQAMWGHSTSPLLVGNRLIVCIDDIVALDKDTGEEVWRTRYGQSWGSPVFARIGNDEAIFMANGRILRASDGKQVARESAPLERASPVVHTGAVYYVGNGGSAYDLPDEVGDKLEMKERWTTDTKGGLFTASPVIHNGLVYAVADRHILNVLDAKTGESIYVRRLELGPEPVWPSLCIAGKYLYVSSRDGATLVLDTGREYKEVARNKLEFFISSPVFHQNRMYVRTNEHLYCIGEG